MASYFPKIEKEIRAGLVRCDTIFKLSQSAIQEKAKNASAVTFHPLFALIDTLQMSVEIIEQFKIKFEATEYGAEMVIMWDTSVVKIPIN